LPRKRGDLDARLQNKEKKKLFSRLKHKLNDPGNYSIRVRKPEMK
jgi:hypothetical protein